MSESFRKSPTFRLFKKKSPFIEGISSILDMGATLQRYNKSSTESEADYEALMSDWKAIGNDLRQSIGIYEQGLTKQV